jgi:predicted NAD/FAD-dependent oxidoreductase
MGQPALKRARSTGRGRTRGLRDRSYDHDSFSRVVVALPGPLTAELFDLSAVGVDVIYLDVDVEPDLAVLGLRDALKG